MPGWQGAEFVGASLQGAEFVGAEFVGTDFVGAEFVGAEFLGAEFAKVPQVTRSRVPLNDVRKSYGYFSYGG